MFKGKKSSKIILIFIDIILLLLISYFSLAIRFDFKEITKLFIDNLNKYIVIDTIILVAVFWIFKMYSSMWSYASIYEGLNILFACTVFTLVELGYKYFFQIQMPRSFYAIQLMLLMLFTFCIRFSDRIINSIKDHSKTKNYGKRTIIVGAGESGRMLLSEITRNRDKFDNNVIYFIDDNYLKRNSFINGVKVIGSTSDIPAIVEKEKIDEIIIAIPSLTREGMNNILEYCQETKASIKVLPGINELIGKPSMKKLRNLSYEDFLSRKEVIIDNKKIGNLIEGKVVLITGGGGSIGSELSRQVAKYKPKKLIIFDIYENNAYNIEQELIRDYPNMELHTIIGSVRDIDRLDNVFKEYKPDYVYHAAAHKHVPLMEISPNESIKNNVLGTLNTVKIADKYKVKKFILISSDKAVRPTNIMGATKRICEMIVQSYDEKSKTEFVAVRFGNVLGSNGSVIPLFLKQIENDGPVTVTDKEITRYFMTIPESVRLILEATTFAKGSEIFVLDMGKPVKIYDLAKKLIKLYSPDKNIPIKIIGLRPGEKLYEELLMEEEGLSSTPNKLIYIGKKIEFDEKQFYKNLDELIKESYKNQNSIKEKIQKIVSNYKPDRRKKDK